MMHRNPLATGLTVRAHPCAAQGAAWGRSQAPNVKRSTTLVTPGVPQAE